jgi:polysaccharide pyruvyl transferase WcaK-like protein
VIGLREGSRGPGLLADLGVSTDRVTVTGDDAIELAYGVRQPTVGADLGICLRVADYSPVADRAKTIVGRVIRDWAAERDAALVPLIISEYRSEDRRSTLPLVAGYPRVIPPLGRFVPAQAVAGRVSRCRILVTGAYHLAVFALSQGIPVVGLSASTYYDDKLLGLAEMFGGGLSLVRLDDPELEARLREAVRTLWEQAPVLRDGLRARAADQIRRSVALYDRIFELVGKRAGVA